MPLPTSPPIAVSHAMLSDIGMRRGNNQDAVGVALDPDGTRGHVFLVADGMGGHSAGELASKLAVDTVPHAFHKHHGAPIAEALLLAVRRANHLIYEKGTSSPEFLGMGTTCSCLVLEGGAATLAHVGDSRVYRLRDGTLEQLTFDHSLVWELAAESRIPAEKAPACIPKNYITRSLGPHDTVNVDLEGPHPVLAGDVYLLCSDGLTNVVEDELIGAVLASMPPGDAAQTLVDLANLRGGPDNISVIAVRVEGAPGQPGARGATSAPSGWASAGLLATGLASAAGLLAGLVTGVSPLAWGAGVALCLVALAGWLWPTAAASPPPTHATALGPPSGRGPYRRFNCTDPAIGAEALRRVTQELSGLRRHAGESNGASKVDWGEYDRDVAAADTARGRGDRRAELVALASAVRGLMGRVRTVLGPGADDDSVLGAER